MNVLARCLLHALVAVMPAIAMSQQPGTSIGGEVRGPGGEAVPDVPVRVTNIADERSLRGTSDAEGRFEFTGLAPGSYRVEASTSFNMAAGRFRPAESRTVELAEGERQVVDLELQHSASIGTIGDDIAVVSGAIRDRQQIPDAPVPRLPDGKPDFSGVWLIGSDPFPESPEALDWAQELFDARAATDFREHPHNDCLPGDAPIPYGGGAPFIAKIVHKPDLMVLLLEDNPGFRQVFLDGRPHPEDPDPTWVGHSIGHWDGDVLVVDTIGYNDRAWMNGYPRSEQLHIVERYSRDEYGRMEVAATIDDPEVFKSPWQILLPMDLAPQEDLYEYVCENNKW